MDNTYSSSLALSSFRRLSRILVTAVACVVLNYLLLNIIPKSFQSVIYRDTQWVRDIGVEYFLFWGVIIAPAWETLFQALPGYILGKSPSRFRVTCYFILAVFPFAAIHAIGYSNLYAVLLLPTSAILTYTYYYFYRRNQMPYLMTAMVHGLYNLLAYFVMTIDQAG